MATEERAPGIQLYTVREAMSKDPIGTLQKIAEIGYREVEFAGYGELSARDVRAAIDDLGIVAPSGHMDARQLRADPAPQLDDAATIGMSYATIGWLQPEDRKTLDDYKGWAEVCNRVGEKCRALGMRMAYHNHDFEFLPLDGGIPYDVLLDETDRELVDFELDFYWVRKARRDIESVLESAPGRFTLAHIKDMDEDGNMADVGDGEIDFGSILNGTSGSQIRHCFVERDDAHDPLDTAATGFKALEAILG